MYWSCDKWTWTFIRNFEMIRDVYVPVTEVLL
jgi:hypothetical protein